LFDIITIGSATRDVLITCPEFFVLRSDKFKTGAGLAMSLGSKLPIGKIVTTVGGGATNTAVGLARQGLKATCMGIVGEDVIGQEILSTLQSENVDTGFFQKQSDIMSGYSVILVYAPSGERVILLYRGKGQHLDASKIDFNKIDTKWIFLDSVGGDVELMDKIINFAKTKNIKLATNPSSRELELGFDKLKPLLHACEIVFLNQEEASLLSGVDYKDEAAIFEFMDAEIGGILVMTKGSAGVSVSDGKNIYTAGVPDSPVVERTGAGDAFCSGFLSEYLRSGDIKTAIQMGTANASSVVTKYGPQEGLLKKGDNGQWPLVEIQVEPLK